MTKKANCAKIFVRFLNLHKNISVKGTFAPSSRASPAKEWKGVPRLECNTAALINHTEKGENIIDSTINTLTNHLKTLREARVLVRYEFQGTKKGVLVHINNQILTVYCKFHKTLNNLEKQTNNDLAYQTFGDNNILTII